MTPDDERHGTYAGAMQHTRAHEPLCEPCRKARNVYHREYRGANPDKYADEREQHRVQDKARRRLARLFPVEFRLLVADELTQERRRNADTTNAADADT